MGSRWVKLLIVVLVLGGIAAALVLVPSGSVGYEATGPVDLDGRVQVDGTSAGPLQGRMQMIGVDVEQLSLGEWLLAQADPLVRVELEPTGGLEPESRAVAALEEQEQLAAATALDLVGEDVRYRGAGASVRAVDPAGPAASGRGDLLQVGDIITMVDGEGVDTAIDVKRRIEAKRPGQQIRLGVRRQGRSLVMTYALGEGTRPDGTTYTQLGVDLRTSSLTVELPRDVEFLDLGPGTDSTAGLPLAMYVYDALSPDDLLRGQFVSALGELGETGDVLPAERVAQVAASAQDARVDVLLVPRGNFAEAQASVESTCEGADSCVQVLPVDSVEQAVELLQRDPAEREAAAGVGTGGVGT